MEIFKINFIFPMMTWATMNMGLGVLKVEASLKYHNT